MFNFVGNTRSIRFEAYAETRYHQGYSQCPEHIQIDCVACPCRPFRRESRDPEGRAGDGRETPLQAQSECVEPVEPPDQDHRYRRAGLHGVVFPAHHRRDTERHRRVRVPRADHPVERVERDRTPQPPDAGGQHGRGDHPFDDPSGRQRRLLPPPARHGHSAGLFQPGVRGRSGQPGLHRRLSHVVPGLRTPH